MLDHYSMQYIKLIIGLFFIVVSLAACKTIDKDSEATVTEVSESKIIIADESEVEVYDLNYPGEFRPEMKIDGKIFYWDGLSYKFSEPDFISNKVVSIANGETYLPDNYSEYSNIASVTSSDVIENCQLKASFDATGVIYTSETTTEAIYVLMSTDWFENKYVRFISSELMDCCICLNGNYYKIDIGNNQIEKELPDGYQSAGVLHFIGIDDIPSNNLETNCIRDTYSYSLEGREVFVDPENIEYLYVYEKQYWAQGEYDGYLKCPIIPSSKKNTVHNTCDISTLNTAHESIVDLNKLLNDNTFQQQVKDYFSSEPSADNMNGCYFSVCGAEMYNVNTNNVEKAMQCFIFTQDLEEIGTLYFNMDGGKLISSYSINSGTRSALLKKLSEKPDERFVILTDGFNNVMLLNEDNETIQLSAGSEDFTIVGDCFGLLSGELELAYNEIVDEDNLVWVGF